VYYYVCSTAQVHMFEEFRKPKYVLYEHMETVVLYCNIWQCRWAPHISCNSRECISVSNAAVKIIFELLMILERKDSVHAQ
jgi:hypothetical protein